MKQISRIMVKIFFLVFMLISYSTVIFSQGDINLITTKSNINQAVQALIDSKGINFAKYDGSYGLSQYNINISSVSLNLIGNSSTNVELSVGLTGRATFNLVVFTFSVNINSTFKVYGNVVLSPQGQGYKLVLNPQGISNFTLTNTFLDDVVQDLANGFIKQLPEISLASYSSMLPGIAAQYFTSGTPTLTVTNDAAILSLTLTAGPRYITAYNEVNQQTNIGFVQDEEGTNNFVTYSSPKRFAWNTGTIQKLQTPEALLSDVSNVKYKYRNWSRVKDNVIQTEIAPRRIQLSIGTIDETYKAKFDQAQHVQLSNVLEGSLSGGTVTYESTTGATFNDYDFSYSINPVQHPINTSVPNGTLGRNWVFQNWSDGNTIAQRTIVLNADKNLIANYKGQGLSNQQNAYTSNSQRKSVKAQNGNLLSIYESMGKVWLERSTNNG
ncbi:MAG: hypothetical protein Q8N03_10455, partial [Ignavibacteria bacterium]|nr:hypothetical protein [Ignavibacteria bacterium]